MPPKDAHIMHDDAYNGYLERHRYLFAQVACKSSSDELLTKNVWGLAVACMSLFIMFLFREASHYFYEADKINEKLLDLKLITVGDYAISGWIPKGVWNKHKEKFPNSNPTMTFMRHLGPEIEK